MGRELQPAMTMKSRLLAVNPHRCGDLIGYANTYACPRDMMIGVVATGYADGYPRHKIDTAQVAVRDRLCDVVGRVSMDMVTVSLEQVPEALACPGAEVELFGATVPIERTSDRRVSRGATSCPSGAARCSWASASGPRLR